MATRRKPTPSELDDALKRFISRCWHEQLRKAGKPQCQRQGNLVWLATMPAGHHYAMDSGPNGSSVLFRFVPLVRRPRGALAHAVGEQSPGLVIARQIIRPLTSTACGGRAAEPAARNLDDYPWW
jgi:hypothetical protein